MSSASLDSERTVLVQNAHGLHARPAAEFVKLANEFESEVTVCRDDLEVNGKSIMGVMMLAAECGTELTVRASGPDAADAVARLVALVDSGFGEE